jgi:hypothetical protein
MITFYVSPSIKFVLLIVGKYTFSNSCNIFKLLNCQNQFQPLKHADGRRLMHMRSLRALNKGAQFQAIRAERYDRFQIIWILFEVSFSLFMNK